jgi:acyl dehydratase
MPTIDDLIADKLTGAARTPLVSRWVLIDQQRIDLFAQATNDIDPLHVDPGYARQYSPYGCTISFGFLTMSLLTHLYRISSTDEGTGYALNYGFDRLRLPAVVPVNSRVRGVFAIKHAERRGDDRALLTYDVRIEIEGGDRPALVADWLAMWVNDGVARPADRVTPD